MYTADLNIFLVYTNIFQIIFPRPQSRSQVLTAQSHLRPAVAGVSGHDSGPR